MFYREFDNHKWMGIILNSVDDDLLWLGDAQLLIDNDLIHRVTSLRNKGCNPINIKNVRKMVEENLNTRFDRSNMKLNSIQDEGVRLISKILC